MPVKSILFAIGLLGLPALAVAQMPPVVAAGHHVAEPAPVAQGHLSYPELHQAVPAGDLPPIPDVWLNSLFTPQPTLEARLEAVWLQPDFPKASPLARQAQLNPDAISFSINDVPANSKEQYIILPRLALEWHLNSALSIEGTAFFMDGPDQVDGPLGVPDQTFLLTAGAGGPIVNAPVGFPAVADRMIASWDFETFGADISLLRHWVFMHGPGSDMAVGLGVKYLRMDENVRVGMFDEISGLDGRMTVKSENNMLGPQAILRGRVQGPTRRLREVAEAKIGLMTNSVTSRTTLEGGGFATVNGASDHVRFAPLIEANFFVEFFLAEHVTIFGGFQMLYVDRVERASEQLNPDLSAFVLGENRFIGSAFLYGPRAGLVISY